MQVNSSYTSSYSPDTNTPRQEQRDEMRQAAAGIAKKNSVEDQIAIYAKTTQNANAQYEDTNEVQDAQSYTENYTDFMKDVRRSENYQTYLDNGGDLSGSEGVAERPSTQPVEEELTQEERDTLRQSAVGIAEKRSVESQIEAYKAGSENSTSTYEETQAYVQNYNDFAKEARRSEYLNIYVENSRLFA